MKYVLSVLLIAFAVAIAAQTADFYADVTTVGAREYVTFISVCDPIPSLYLWNFGDGYGDGQSNPAHIYQSGGLYTVTLTAVWWTHGSQTVEKQNYINVLEADFSVAQQSGNAPFSASFYDNSLGRYSTAIWDFGDETDPVVIGPATQVFHRYETGGDYDVTLTISDSTGVQHSKTITDAIHVNDDLSVDFQADITTGPAPLNVHFYSEVTGNIQSYEWDFGDESGPSYDADPFHTYTTNGIYTVSLTVSDGSDEATATHQDYIVVGTVVDTSQPIDNALWDFQSSPFIVNDNLQIGQGGQLVIEPDVVVCFREGFVLQNNGNLEAQGATFRGIESGSWGGLIYSSGSGGTLSYSEILNATNGISILRSGRDNPRTPTLSNIRIKTSDSATRPAGTGLSVEGDFSGTLDGITIENYAFGIDIDNTQATSTPTLSNIRVKQSDSATRTYEDAINITGNCDPVLQNINIENYNIGIVIDDTGSDPLSTPTLSNIRIKTSDSATRSVTQAILLMNATDVQIGGTTANDSIIIEGYPMGIEIYQSFLRSRSTPTLSNIRIKQSDSATRIDTSAILIHGPVDAHIEGVIIDGFMTGIDYYQTGDVRDTPTLSNIRIKQSDSATRSQKTGIRVDNIESIIIGGEAVSDSVIIENCDIGISVFSNRGRSRATPTLSNIRIKTSDSATRESTSGFNFNGSVVANLKNAIIEGCQYGIFYDMSPALRDRSTPTLSNIRIKQSDSATRELNTGIFLQNVDAIIVGDSTHAADIVIEGYQTGVRVTAPDREISTPTLSNIRIKQSDSATRGIGDGVHFTDGATGVIRNCKIENFANAILLDNCGAVSAYGNTLNNNDTGLRANVSASPLKIHHNTIYLDPGFAHDLNGNSGIMLDTVSDAMVNNNTIYGYDIGTSANYSNAIWSMNIVWSDDQYDQAINNMDATSTVQARYNNMLNYSDGTGNIDLNPRFIDAPTGNFTLRANSPCINAGDPDFNNNGSDWTVDPMDQDPDGTQMDIGAFCYDANNATIPGQPDNGLPTGNNVSVSFPSVFWSDDMDVFRWSIHLDITPDYSSPGAIVNTNLMDNQYDIPTDYLLYDTQYWVTISPRNIRDEVGPPLEWSFTTQQPEGSPNHDNGTGLAGEVIDSGGWSGGFYEMDIPQVGDIQFPSVTMQPNATPSGQVVLIIELGIKGGEEGSEQRLEYEAFIGKMASVETLDDLEMALRISCTDQSVYNGNITLTLSGYPYDIQYIYYSLGGGTWIPIPAWTDGAPTPYFIFDGTNVVITGLNTGRADGDLDLGFGSEDFTLPVTLSSFTATTTSAGFVQINWITQSEEDLLGYNVYRNEVSQLNDATLISIPMIDATNTGNESIYEYPDYDVEVEHTYFYWLQIMELTGHSQFCGPVSVTVTDPGDEPPAPVFITELSGNYPNPFNPTTLIKYSVAEQCDVEIAIYNIKGQKVRTYKNDGCPEGEHSIEWHGDDDTGKSVASGIYFIKMETENYKKIVKAMMIK